MPKPTYKTTHSQLTPRSGATRLTISVGHREKQELGASTRFSFVEDCKRSGDIEVWINLNALVRLMGPDALRSKSRAAKRVNGLVQVRAVNVTEVKS